MQKLIKLKLVDLGYNKKSYNPYGLMDWLDEKNNIVFITIPELIDSKIFMPPFYNFLTPAITNYKDYLKIKEKYGGLPIALEEYQIKYLEWLKSIKFYDFVKQNNINLNMFEEYWIIFFYNYKSIKKINSELEKPIKIKKIKI